MGYNLAVLGCGTMGIAILSSVLSSLPSLPISSSSFTNGHDAAADNSTPPSASGYTTPTSSQILSNAPADSLPSKFFVTVGREESVKKLKKALREIEGAEVELTSLDPSQPQSHSSKPSTSSAHAPNLNPKAIKIQIGHGEHGNLLASLSADVILLCCKPQGLQPLLTNPELQQHLSGKTIISICAGVTVGQIEGMVPSDCVVVRAMPNTPSKIGEGMTIITPPSTKLTRQILLSLFSPCGRVRFLDEKHFDACTALAGSGPAFVALVLEAMADGGVMMGLPRAEALELAAQTMQGTARMALHTGLHPAQLKDSVTTPGGCTIAGLLTLEDGKVRSTMARAIQVATLHAAGLGQGAKKQ